MFLIEGKKDKINSLVQMKEREKRWAVVNMYVKWVHR